MERNLENEMQINWTNAAIVVGASFILGNVCGWIAWDFLTLSFFGGLVLTAYFAAIIGFFVALRWPVIRLGEQNAM